jgi:hypothetical protein
MNILFGILSILLALYIYGGYTRHRAGEINVLFYYNGARVKIICLFLLVLGVLLFLV